MKISIDRHELQRGLARLQSVTEKRNSMPILANILMTARDGSADGQLELAGTDLEVGMRSEHACKVEEAGALTISGRKLYEIVRELPEEPVELSSSENSYLSLRCARSKFTLAGTTAEEYPTFPEFSPERTFTVQTTILAEMIEKTMYAASSDEARYNLNGVYLERIEELDKLRIVATDGHRLAYVDRTLGGHADVFDKGVIIPRKGLAELKKLLDEEDSDEIELGFEGSSGLARKGGVVLTLRLIEGEFPNYRNVIPEEGSQRLVLEREGFVHALRRVALLSSDRSRAVNLKLSAGELALSSKNPDLGEAHETLAIDYAGEEFMIAFNARYLVDAVNALGSKEVCLVFKDALSPMRVTPMDDTDTLAVVMPMRI